MKKINIRRVIYRLKNDFLTLNNIVLVLALLVSANWVWGSLEAMQRNYGLQKELDDKKRQLIVAQLDNETAKLEQRYYKTDEYKDLAVRSRLGLVSPGEKVLILPANSEVAKNIDKAASSKTSVQELEISNFDQWLNFLFGISSQKISDN